MKRIILIGLLVISVSLAGCGEDENDDAGLANPASVYCLEQGGTLEMRTDDAGTSGYCIFEDGSECEEWAYFRAECAPGDNPGG
jgi:putative hemolysin